MTKQPLKDALESRIAHEPMSGCFIWSGYSTNGGYGSFRGKSAHRLMWESENGPIADGYVLCHRCDNRLCVNPAHLFVGTQSDNISDMHSKGRGRRPMKYGNSKKHDLYGILAKIRQSHQQSRLVSNG